MKFKDFLESSYMSANINLATSKSASDHGRVQATQELITLQRLVYKLYHKVQLLIEYGLIKLHLKKPPKDAQTLFDEARAPKEEVVPSPTSEPNYHI